MQFKEYYTDEELRKNWGLSVFLSESKLYSEDANGGYVLLSDIDIVKLNEKASGNVVYNADDYYESSSTKIVLHYACDQLDNEILFGDEFDIKVATTGKSMWDILIERYGFDGCTNALVNALELRHANDKTLVFISALLGCNVFLIDSVRLRGTLVKVFSHNYTLCFKTCIGSSLLRDYMSCRLFLKDCEHVAIDREWRDNFCPGESLSSELHYNLLDLKIMPRCIVNDYMYGYSDVTQRVVTPSFYVRPESNVTLVDPEEVIAYRGADAQYLPDACDISSQKALNRERVVELFPELEKVLHKEPIGVIVKPDKTRSRRIMMEKIDNAMPVLNYTQMLNDDDNVDNVYANYFSNVPRVLPKFDCHDLFAMQFKRIFVKLGDTDILLIVHLAIGTDLRPYRYIVTVVQPGKLRDDMKSMLVITLEYDTTRYVHWDVLNSDRVQYNFMRSVISFDMLFEWSRDVDRYCSELNQRFDMCQITGSVVITKGGTVNNSKNRKSSNDYMIKQEDIPWLKISNESDYVSTMYDELTWFDSYKISMTPRFMMIENEKRKGFRNVSISYNYACRVVNPNIDVDVSNDLVRMPCGFILPGRSRLLHKHQCLKELYSMNNTFRIKRYSNFFATLVSNDYYKHKMFRVEK